jgi:hypothetical protein
MVPAWVALSAWLVCWILLAKFSMALLKGVRPGETVPLRRGANGQPMWRVSPAVAALLTPAAATVVGVVTLVMGYLYAEGRAPIMNVVLAGIFVLAHGMQVHTSLKLLEQERK